MIEMIDRHDMESLENEYVMLALAELTDDVDCSLSTMQMRTERLDEIEELVGSEICNEWSNEAEKQAKNNGFFASGKVYK